MSFGLVSRSVLISQQACQRRPDSRKNLESLDGVGFTGGGVFALARGVMSAVRRMVGWCQQKSVRCWDVGNAWGNRAEACCPIPLSRDHAPPC